MSEPEEKTYTLVVDLSEEAYAMLTKLRSRTGMSVSDIVSEALIELQKLEEMIEFIADEDDGEYEYEERD